jgi:chitodextrinase
MKRIVILGAAAALTATGLGAPAAADGGAPATPQRLYATNGATSITLSWTEPATGGRPASFNVYENGAVVARNTTTHVTISNLVFDSTHTYTVTAVGSSGQESAASASISRTAILGGPFACGFTTPSNLATSNLTASGVSLAWSNAEPYYDQPGTLVVLLDGVAVAQTALDSARISGLAPASTHTVAVARRDCNGTLHTSAPLTITTLSGPGSRPAAPTGLAVTGTTNASVGLSWSAAATAADYAVYDGGNLVAVATGTTATVTGLWRDTPHQFTVSALDAAGGESAQSAPAVASTQPCDTVTPAPTGLSATPRSPSTVALSWISTVQSTGFVVYRSGVQVATVAGPSAVVTGLPSADTAQYSVAVRAVANGGGCGISAPGAPVTATTPSGPAARPAAPTSLAVTRQSSNSTSPETGTVTLSWSQPASGDPVTGYRLYDGSAVLAATTTTGATLTLPAGPSHTVYVVALDAAGNESSLDGPVTFTVPFIPFP